MKYTLLIFCFLVINPIAFSQSWDKKIDSVYRVADRENIDSLVKSYKVIFNFLKNMSYDDAVSKCEDLKTKTLHKGEKNYFEEFLISNNLAWFYAKKDKKKGVSEYFRLVNTIPEMKKVEQAYAWYFAGKFHISIGMHNLGAKYMLKAIDAFKLTDNWLKLFRIHYALGDTYYKAQLYREAIKEMQQALSYYPNIDKNKKKPESSLTKMFMSAYNTIALAYEKLGQPDSAEVYYKRAKQIALETNNLLWQYIIDANMGHIYILKKKYDSAEIVFKKDEILSKKYNQEKDVINDMVRLAQVYMLTGRLDSSENKLKQCRQYALLHNKNLPYLFYKVYSELNEKKGDYKNSLRYLKQYYFMVDSVKNITLSKKMSRINVEHTLEKEQSRLREMEIQNKIDSAKITMQTLIIIGLILLSVILIVLFVIYYRDRKKISALNAKLSSANEKLQAGNKELSSALQSLKTTQTQLLQNEKMASLGILTSGIAHEINNPLNYIMGAYIGLTDYFNEHNNIEEKEEIELFLRSIYEGINRISSIIKGLNQFSRNNSRYDEDCDIHFIIDNCIFLLGSTLKHRIDVQKDYFPESLVIMGNTGKLHQAFFNILLNSVQAIKNNGIISIKTEKDNDKISVIIKDNGCGISKENIKRVMVPFFTTKSPGDGVGLGLSISHSIIKEHKGNIIFDSEIGKGTTVVITFPLKNDIV